MDLNKNVNIGIKAQLILYLMNATYGRECFFGVADFTDELLGQFFMA
jgi:hypothetical protein